MRTRTESLLEKANSDDRSENSVSLARKVFAEPEEAGRIFLKFKDKVTDLKAWNACAVETSFKLFDKNGIVHREQKLLDKAFIRLSMKGSGKNDWVRVAEIYETADEKIITVKPADDPTEKKNQPRISHFFGSEASNNFCLLKHKQSIAFYVIGLREKQNISETDGVVETIRNIAVANIGSYFGIQKAEWEIFCKNFLNSED